RLRKIRPGKLRFALLRSAWEVPSREQERTGICPDRSRHSIARCKGHSRRAGVVAQRKILVDTNSYLRLAQSIHPLLFSEFGPNACCLYVLKELDDELNA